MVSASLYFHFSLFDLQRTIPVLSLFKHLQCNHGASYLVPRFSDGMDFNVCGTDRRWWVHALSDSARGLVSSGVTEWTKLFLVFRRLFYRLVTVYGMTGICFILSCRDVVVLLTPGRAIPARDIHSQQTLVSDILLWERHASFRSGSGLFTYLDLSHTGHAYSAVEVAECTSCWFYGCWLGSPFCI